MSPNVAIPSMSAGVSPASSIAARTASSVSSSAGDTGAAADPRNAEAADDRVLLEVAHRAPRMSIFVMTVRLDCTFLGMADDAAPEIPARMLPTLTTTTGRSGPAAATDSCTSRGASTCRLWVQPPGADCPDCGGALVDRPVSGRGTVFTYTVNYQPFHAGRARALRHRDRSSWRSSRTCASQRISLTANRIRFTSAYLSRCVSNATTSTATPSSSRCSRRGPSGTRIRAAPNTWR